MYGKRSGIITSSSRGTVIGGVSAGMICWFDWGVTDSIPGALTPLRCLGWLHGSACPHYDAEKARRLERLITLQESVGAEINRGLVGSDVEVLVEGPARRTEGWMSGKSPQLKTVVFPGPATAGELCRVRVEATTAHTLSGVAVG